MPALDDVSRGIIQFVGHGPRSHSGPYLKDHLRWREIDGPKYTAEWDAQMQRESDQAFHIAAAEEKFIAEHRIARDRLPCIAFFEPHQGIPFEIIELPPASWESASAFGRLSKLLLERFDATQLAAVVPADGCSVQPLLAYVQRIQDEIAALIRDPNDLISLAVALREFAVSRATLERGIKSGEIQSFRPPCAAKTAKHRVSRAQLAAMYPTRNTSAQSR